MLFTADHHGFYQDGQPFFPLIQDNDFPLMEWANTIVIRLPAQLHDDLDWSKQIEQAHAIADKYLFWEIDLGLGHYSFDPQDSAAFLSFTLALDEFSAKIWPSFADRTLGVSLYRGVFDPSLSFPLSKWELFYSDWMEEMRSAVPEWHELKSSAVDDYPLFCARNFAAYLHRLVSFLPDAVLPFALIDVSRVSSPAKVAQLFSKEHFEHTQLILKGAPCPFSGLTWEEGELAHGWMGHALQNKSPASSSSLGIYLPKDPMIDSSILKQLDALMASLKAAQTSFRIISEEKLTEQWDGLDRLIVPSKAVSAQGRRKLLGFIAAGGTVATFGEPLDLPEESSFIVLS